MKKLSVLFPLAVLCCISLVLGGCAKKAVVKEEGAAKEATAAAKPKPAKPEKSAVKDDGEAKRRAERDAAAKAKAARDAAAAAAQKVYELVNINFDFDKFTLKDDARKTLKDHADWLNKNSKVSIIIEGHCDERGTAEYNLALGERRAAEAKKYLGELGVAASRMKTVSYGKSRPLDPGHNESAWAKNRRDQFVPAANK